MKKMLVLLVLLVPCMALAEGSEIIQLRDLSVSGTKVTGLAKAAASVATVTDGIYLGRSSQHSVMLTVETTQTLSLTVVPMMSADGTTYCTPTPTAAVVLAPTATDSTKGGALNLPCAAWYRFSLSADATYPTTYTAVKIQSW